MRRDTTRVKGAGFVPRQATVNSIYIPLTLPHLTRDKTQKLPEYSQTVTKRYGSDWRLGKRIAKVWRGKLSGVEKAGIPTYLGR